MRNEKKKWENAFQKLLLYKKANGHCNVPRYFEDHQLTKFVSQQRQQYKRKCVIGKNKTLTDEREKRLNEIGFVWSFTHRFEWNIRFAELLEFVVKHGHAQIPFRYKGSTKLWNWVLWQRHKYNQVLMGKRSTLSKERIEFLNSIGFQWEWAPQEQITEKQRAMAIALLETFRDYQNAKKSTTNNNNNQK